MKILHINQSDIDGGAAIAGYRLHQGLLRQGLQSRQLVGNAKTGGRLVSSIPRKYRTENLLASISRQLGLNYINLISSFDIPNHEFYQDADILNFHNLHTGYFNYLTIPKLTETKPAIFTLHDMWSFTGHCTYSYDCNRWREGCGRCPYPDIYPRISRDNTSIEWKLKNWIYGKSNLTVVAPSFWLVEQAQASMLSQFPIHHIPYGIDTDIYKPLDPLFCKTALDLPTDKNILLFGAENLKDTRKGGDLLLKALQELPPSLKSETILLTFGHAGESIVSELGMHTFNLGYTNNDRLKSLAFSAADLFIFPTRADNLPLVLQESMACGTPMISFKVGGVPDLVRHNITGYLAESEDFLDFCNGIISLLENKFSRKTMGENCRAIALHEYSLELQAKRYVELYTKVLQ